jgi:propionate CoA-transferase
MAGFLSADEAVAQIPDGATLGMTGILMCGVAEEVAAAIERAFRDRGHPRDLTLVHASGIGNWHEGGRRSSWASSRWPRRPRTAAAS